MVCKDKIYCDNCDSRYERMKEFGIQVTVNSETDRASMIRNRVSAV